MLVQYNPMILPLSWVDAAASALADQRLAGALMLYPGAIVFVVAAVLTISRSDSGR